MIYLRYLSSILGSLLLVIIIYLSAVFYQVGTPTETSLAKYELYKIKSSIVNLSKTPKLLIISGSNALEGISCKIIEEETKFPCVNGSTSISVGIDYLLHYARSWAKPGDIVLLPLEYTHYQYDGKPFDELVDYVISRDPKYLLSADLITKIRILGGVSFSNLLVKRIFQPKFPQLGTNISQEIAVNKYGDKTNNIESNMTPELLKKRDEFEALRFGGYIKSSQGMESISKFINWCKQNNIKVIATWPNTMKFEIYKEFRQQEFFRSIENFYKSIGVPLLGKPEDFMYNKSMLYDAPYHLNDRGVRQRTRQLIDLLRPYLPRAVLL
jgi:hypothetical protein